MLIYLDATPLIALGRVGRLDLFDCFDGEVVVPPAVLSEVTHNARRERCSSTVLSKRCDTEPARINAKSFLGAESTHLPEGAELLVPDAAEVLGEGERNGDVEIVAAVLHHVEGNGEVGVVSDDGRVRTVTRGLGATVTGTVGTVVRSLDEDVLDVDEGKALVRELDRYGLHMTGELREEAYRLVEEAGEEDSD